MAGVPLQGVPLPQPGTEPPPRRLAEPVAIPGDFVTVSGVHELRDGRVVISDAKTPALLLHDPATRRNTPIGRRGEGPNEYLAPGGSYPAAADSTFVLDRGQTRFLVLDPAGRPVGTRSWSFPGVRSYTADDRDQQRLDARGRLYTADLMLNMAALRQRMSAPPGSIDSAPILRYDAARPEPDTIARLRLPEVTRSSAGGTMLSVETAFSPADGWAVTSDGRVAVVRASPYRVEWYDAAGARRVAGSVIAVSEVRVTSADRAAIEEADAANRRQMFPTGGIQLRGQRDTITPSSMPERKYADVKPPFERYGVLMASDGRLWVRRTRPAGSRDEIYDVFDARGERVDRIAFPARSHVVGASGRHVYVSTLDEDDLPHLFRYLL